MLLGSVCSAVLAGIGIVILAVCILAPTEGHALHFDPEEVCLVYASRFPEMTGVTPPCRLAQKAQNPELIAW